MLGRALVLALAVTVACGPSRTIGPGVPAGWAELEHDRWELLVPANWQPEPVFRPDAPNTSLYLTVPSMEERRRAGCDAPYQESAAEVHSDAEASRADPCRTTPLLMLHVVQAPRGNAQLDDATRTYANDKRDCPGCLTRTLHSRRTLSLNGREVTLNEVRYSDGSTGWLIVALNDCYIFVVDLRMWSSDFSEIATRIIESFRLHDHGRWFGCL